MIDSSRMLPIQLAAFLLISNGAFGQTLPLESAIQAPNDKRLPSKPIVASEPIEASEPMLKGPWVPEDTQKIDFSKLPRVPRQHSIVSDVHAKQPSTNGVDKKNGGVNQHNYLSFFNGKFWIMWSDGPGVEDRVGQRVKFASSRDGLAWTAPEFLTPEPPHSGPSSPHYGTRSEQGFRYIARGFWNRDGVLLALASLDEAAGFFGPSLELHAFALQESQNWSHMGIVFDDAINNFPPQKLPSGEWMMSRRTHNYKSVGVEFLIGGVRSFDHWNSFPVHGSSSILKAEEPEWWVLPNGHLCALFRDNSGSGYLFRSFSSDNGRSWTKPIKTNFPDATSKVNCLRLRDGRYVLISNPRPKKRDPLVLSLSDDGITFNKMIYLVGDRHVDYPHALEHDGHLLVAFSGGKQSVEVLKIKLEDIDSTPTPDRVLAIP